MKTVESEALAGMVSEYDCYEFADEYPNDTNANDRPSRNSQFVADRLSAQLGGSDCDCPTVESRARVSAVTGSNSPRYVPAVVSFLS
jgi:hypothetical protein